MNGQFLIADLNSRNGTFVNGLPVHERELKHNDQVRVGDSVFLFQRNVPLESGESVEVDGTVATKASTMLKSDQSLYFDRERLNQSLGNRTARGVEALFRISNTLQSAQSIEALEKHLLDILFEAIPAKQGAILMSSGGSFASHRVDGDGAVR